MYPKLHLHSKEDMTHATFLVSAAKYADGISSRVLKSHLNILSYETLRMKNFARGKRFKKTESCEYCLTSWRNGEFSLKVLPISKKQQRMKKLFKNIAKHKPLVKIERKLANARNIRNILLVKCSVCTKETRIKLREAYELLGVSGKKTVPGLASRWMGKKMKEKTKVEMKTKEKKSSDPHPGVNSDHVSGPPSQQASEENSNQKKSHDIGRGISQNGDEDEDEIKIMFERRPPEKRTLDCIELDQGQPAKKRKKKKAKKNASRGFGVLDTPSSTPYNTPGDNTYNTPLSTGCAVPYNMQYNAPYGIPYSIDYSTLYNSQTSATPYNTSYNSAYDETYANYGNYSGVGYIPLDSGADASKKKKKRKKKKKKGASKNQNSGNNDSGKDLVLNPFCDQVKEICDLPRKKKLSKWKKLISEEENKPTQSTSFEDFLDKLKTAKELWKWRPCFIPAESLPLQSGNENRNGNSSFDLLSHHHHFQPSSNSLAWCDQSDVVLDRSPNHVLSSSSSEFAADRKIGASYADAGKRWEIRGRDQSLTHARYHFVLGGMRPDKKLAEVACGFEAIGSPPLIQFTSGLEVYNERLSQRGTRPEKPEPAIKGTANEMAAGKVLGSGSDGQFRHLVGRTQGMIRSGLLSVIEGSSDIFSGISSKLESALSMSVDSNSSHSEAEGVTPSKDSACDESIPSNRELRASGPDPFEKLNYKIEAASSESGSSKGGYGPSTSLELSETWRSGSEGSVSSLSADGQTDEADAKCFMESYVATLFRDCSSLSLEDKASFGKHVQTEPGRTWFARLINCERTRFKCVSEPTFYSLVQHFAIVLFECADADHFSPAKTLMNMCFTFYHEVDVPGCEPFREYLAAYLKNQPIWQSLRFWNAAFFDALQCERLHRPVVTREEVRQNRLEAITDERQYQENITFGQLGTFTCNMHAFGLDKELCCEFLRKQCLIAALAPDQERMLHENVERMYEQTEPWR